jgi:pimeloyl-ACP methyl ester carboxylesterase
MDHALSPAHASRNPGDDERRQLLAGLALTEHTRTFAGIETSCVVAGHGAPIVLLHGPCASAVHWLAVLPDLMRTHRVIAPDLPGHGRSKLGKDELDAERTLLWLSQLIQETCGGVPPVLVGHLVGGAIGARLAIRHRSLLSGLVLIDTFGLVPLTLPPQFAAAMGAFLQEPTARAHDELWQYCAHDLPALRDRMGDRWQLFTALNVAAARDQGVQTALGSLMEAFALPALPPSELARISVPTTLIWGRHDLAQPLSIATAAAGRYGWPLHVIEDSADDPPIEQPEALLRAVRTAIYPGAAPARRSVS